METLVEKNSKLVEHTVSKLQEETVITFKEVWDFAQFNDYVYSRHPKFNEDDLKAAIGNLTLNERKKLKKKINTFRMKQTLGAANRFYHHVYAKVLKVDMRVRLEYPEKYQKIQEKRKNYVKALAEMKKLYAEYKDEKGTYFIDRIKKGQKVQ